MTSELRLEQCEQNLEAIKQSSIMEIQKRAVLRNDGAGECEWCGEQFPRLVNNACGRCRDEYKLE